MKTKRRAALKVHISIQVRDIERSMEFYRRLFGVEPSKVRTGYAKFDVAEPPLNFVLNEVLDEVVREDQAGRMGSAEIEHTPRKPQGPQEKALGHPPSATLRTGELQHSGLSHLGIQVASTEEVVATRDRWKAAGLEPRDEMSTICCYALQDKSWVSDPDGNEWEVFVVLKDNLPEKSTAASACCEPTCCVAH